MPLHASDDYTLGPDSQPQEGVPKGKVIGPTLFKSKSSPAPSASTGSMCPPSTTAASPPRDGLPGRRQLRERRAGQFRVPVVFDNLIHKKEMPVTIGIFINPGQRRRHGAAGEPGARRTAASSTTRSATHTRVPARGDPARGRQELQAAPSDPDGARDLRHQLRRHLRVHRRLGAARRVPQGAQPRRQLHQHPRRPRLSRR